MENEDSLLLEKLDTSVSELLPYLKKKIVIVWSQKSEDTTPFVNMTPFVKNKIVEIFFRGLIIDEIIEIETEIEDVILNARFGKNSQSSKDKRDFYRDYSLRKREAYENRISNKISELIVISKVYLRGSEEKELISSLNRIKNYRNNFAHKESKYDTDGKLFIYHNGERRIPMDINFIKEILEETLRIKELLTKIKKEQ